MTPDVMRPLHRAVASAITAAKESVAAVRYVTEAVETWLDERIALFDARADLNDPELIEEFDEES